MKIVKVRLKTRSYDITVQSNVMRSLPDYIDSFRKESPFLILTDSNISGIYGNLLKSLCKKNTVKLVVPAGEKSKSFKTVEKILTFMIQNKLDRNSMVVALGGGVIGDLAGFVSSIYMRGIPFIQVPTTLLAQVDSSVGGKTGVNHPLGKNIIGAFHQPKAVFIDTAFLQTLSQREYLNGYAEVIKHGLIRDKNLFSLLEDKHQLIMKRDSALMENIVARNCSIKADVVERDELEKSLRAILNFGHTFGHAIETISKYKSYSHGEAVMLGMRAALVAGRSLNVTSVEDVVRAINYLELTGMPDKTNSTFEKVYAAMFADKKTLGGKLNIVLIEKIGKACLFSNPPKRAVSDGIATMIRQVTFCK